MNRTIVLFAAGAALLAVPARASTPCFQLEGQTYCRAWSASDASMSKTEFVRASESVDRWKRMVTILRYNDLHTIEQATKAYLSVVKPYLQADARPQWVTPSHPKHAQEAATRLLLTTGNDADTEYVVVYFFADPGKPAYAIAFSQHLPLADGEPPTLAQYGGWLRDLQAIVPANVEPAAHDGNHR